MDNLQSSIDVLRNHGHEKLAMSLAIEHELKTFLDLEPLLLKDLQNDLNPHIQIINYCTSIADRVRENFNIECDGNDVILYWITIAFTNKQFLPQE